MKYHLKECVGCNVKFKTKYGNKVYCTPPCQLKNTGRLHICEECGIEFKGKGHRKYCSSKCWHKINIENLIKRNKIRRLYPEHPGLSKGQVFCRYNKQAKEKCLKKDIDKRLLVVAFLGGKCVTCGYEKDKRALVLDHKNGDGKEDRKERGSKLFRYYCLNLEEAKERLQVLCANCNMIKAMENKEHNKSRRINHDEYKC